MQLKVDIETELRSDPRVQASQIDVTVEGTVSLWGAVGNYPEKWAAEAAIMAMDGVTSFQRRVGVPRATVRHAG